MSFENLGISEIGQADNRTLFIRWTDGSASHLDVVDLRRRCPCANCVDEWTHEKILNDKDIKDEVRPLRVESVGRYAVKITFSDMHATGIYTYKMLRSLPPKQSLLN